jgi:hypothetical protein
MKTVVINTLGAADEPVILTTNEAPRTLAAAGELLRQLWATRFYNDGRRKPLTLPDNNQLSLDPARPGDVLLNATSTKAAWAGWARTYTPPNAIHYLGAIKMEPNVENQEPLTPAEQLAAQQQQTTEEMARRLELEGQLEKQRQDFEDFTNSEKYDSAISDAICAIGRPAFSKAAVKKMFATGTDGMSVIPGPNGPEPVLDGQVISWPSAMQRFYVAHPTFFQYDPQEEERRDEERKATEIKSKADFRCKEHLSNWLSVHGSDAFAMLPATRDGLLGDRNPHYLTREEYSKLSVEEKTRVSKELGVSGVERILGRR